MFFNKFVNQNISSISKYEYLNNIYQSKFLEIKKKFALKF